ncbi:hypothetical protein BpHYR1_049857 [Brachionus plicatilis]|uniref:Uncharacterized protein n=1 Tax=Brachionus plicatilis TaxID=10195 RepID=A0A3M7P6Z4_BRAPC|nr:hypothetical protein BpHYR1_049857 [Brachionus plicatilis]
MYYTMFLEQNRILMLQKLTKYPKKSRNTFLHPYSPQIT